MSHRTAKRIKALDRNILDAQIALARYLKSQFFPTPTGFTLEQIGFTGPVIPQPGPLLREAFQQAGALGESPLLQTIQQGLAQATSAQLPVNFDPALREQLFREQVVTPTLRVFEREIVPRVAFGFLPGGQTGAARQFLNQAIADITQGFAAQRAAFLRDDERLALQSALQARQIAGIAAPAALEAIFRPMGALANLGLLQRQLEAQANAERLARALMAQPFGDPRLALLGAVTNNPILVNLGTTPLGLLSGGLSALGSLGTFLPGG